MYKWWINTALYNKYFVNKWFNMYKWWINTALYNKYFVNKWYTFCVAIIESCTFCDV